MTNRYPGKCEFCGGHVAPSAGTCRKPPGARRYSVAHLACSATGQPEVATVVLAGGTTLYQNRRGRCEDAPCCGCCTY